MDAINQELTTILLGVITLCCALFLRILPNHLSSGHLGVDHWFWKAYIETYRRDKKFPPDLPQYLLDEHQWYPPLFPLLLSYLPGIVFDRYSHFLAILIDLLRMVFLLCVVNWISGGDPYAVAISGLVYATTPILLSYNIQLNPRGLGALFLDGLIILLLWRYLFNGPVWVCGMVLLLSGLILLTHKMTTQLFWFLCLGVGLLTMDWRAIALIPASVFMALLMSKGFYWKVLCAHWDIVTFWNRNWRWLQAHPIKESPIYGAPNFETPTKFHRKGLKGIIRHFGYLFGYNPQVWILCGLIIAGIFSIPCKHYSVLLWVGLTLFFSLATVFVPFTRCLGAGYFYLYNAAFPVAILWGILINTSNSILLAGIGFFLALGLGLVSIVIFYRRLARSTTQKIDDSFENVLNYLKNAPKGTVMCFPPQWYDVIAYKTGQPVLYGGHGYGFKLLEPLFPRLLLRMQEIVRRYPVSYLVTLEGYLSPNFLADCRYKSVSEFGRYRVYDLS